MRGNDLGYVFYPGVFRVSVVLHLLAETIYQNSLIPH